MADPIEKFSISLDGDKTGEKWHGEFSVKVFLSHRDELRRDAIRRELLGDVNPQYASVRQANQADIFSDLNVRVVSAPSWWKESGNGIDLIDDNIVAKVYEKVQNLEKAALDAIKAKAEKAKEELAKVNASPA